MFDTISEVVPTCDFDFLGDDELTAWCSIMYRGNWAPVVEWRVGSADGPVIDTGISNETNAERNAITYTMTIQLNDTTTADEYLATTKFVESMRPRSTTSTNIPTYNYTWICCEERVTGEFKCLISQCCE